MKKYLALAILPFVTCTTFAADNSLDAKGMKQNITVQLNVNGDLSADGFYAGFVSSDIFDHGHSTQVVRNGTLSTSHVYGHGQKNIRVFVAGAYPNKPTYVKVVPDSSCEFLHQDGEKRFQSTYIRATEQNETWIFNIDQAAPEDGFRYVYNLKCDHIVS